MKVGSGRPKDVAVPDSYVKFETYCFAPTLGLPLYIALAIFPKSAAVGMFRTPPHCFTAPAQ